METGGRAAWAVAAFIAAAACHPTQPRAPAGRNADTASHALGYVEAALTPWPGPAGPYLVAVSAKEQGRASSYDNALAALLLVGYGKRDHAGRLLGALAELQHHDGSIPFAFSVTHPDPSEQRYVRTGAIAWIGYVAVEYLNTARGGPAREAITAMSHRCAQYLLAHQIAREGDPRDGLVTGGEGTYRYTTENAEVRQILVSGEVSWTSTEHNIDAYFFLTGLARLTGDVGYQEAADRIARSLLSRAWSAEKGQFVRGLDTGGPDPALALDCASWGALFLVATGQRARSVTALGTADARFATRDDATGVHGHRPYAHAPVLTGEVLARHASALPHNDWDRLNAVWAEGSAGVALAAFRLGDRAGAESILDGLERLRHHDGGLPMLTTDVPFEFDTHSSLAATIWVELVRAELALAPQLQTLWVAHPITGR